MPLPGGRVDPPTYELECHQGRLPPRVGVHDPPGSHTHRRNGPSIPPTHASQDCFTDTWKELAKALELGPPVSVADSDTSSRS